jgi:hypothetical protein
MIASVMPKVAATAQAAALADSIVQIRVIAPVQHFFDILPKRLRNINR